MTEAPLRIAWFAAVEPTSDLIWTVSHYAADLLIPRLRDRFEIELFSNVSGGTFHGVPSRHYLTAWSRHRDKPFDLFFYHFGDEPRERFIRMHLGVMPGVSWLHDLYLRDLGAEGMHTSPWQHTVRQYLDPSLPCARREPPPVHVWPAAYRETALSPVALFPSSEMISHFKQWRHERIEASPGWHRADVLPLPIPMNTPHSETHEEGAFHILCRARLSHEGRAELLLRSLARIEGPWRMTWITGVADVARAHKLVHEYGLGSRVTIIGEVPISDWAAISSSVDCALFLAGPYSGFLTPFLEISLSVGCPSVVIDHGRTSTIPDEVVFKIEPGVFEGSQLEGVLRAIVTSTDKRFGQGGRAFALQRHGVTDVASRLEGLLRQSAPLLRGVMERWALLEKNAQRDLGRDLREVLEEPVLGFPSCYDSTVAPWLSELEGTLLAERCDPGEAAEDGL